MQQKLSLGFNVVDWVSSLWKHPTRLCGTNFCINRTSSACFAPSFVQKRNGLRCTQTLWNDKRWVWGPMGSIGCVRCENIRRDFVALTFALIAPVRPILHRVYCRNKMLPNAPKHYETHHNMSLGSDAVDWADLLQRILLQLCGLNFCIKSAQSTASDPKLMLWCVS